MVLIITWDSFAITVSWDHGNFQLASYDFRFVVLKLAEWNVPYGLADEQGFRHMLLHYGMAVPADHGWQYESDKSFYIMRGPKYKILEGILELVDTTLSGSIAVDDSIIS